MSESPTVSRLRHLGIHRIWSAEDKEFLLDILHELEDENKALKRELVKSEPAGFTIKVNGPDGKPNEFFVYE